ncbi:Bud site selection protein 14 [Candida tropicalis]
MERFKRIDMNHLDVESDDEDGKVGFVPAECLETYGERLARLNCFKNEELEKVCAPLAREESAVSLNKKSGSNSSSTNNVAKKSVTFENLGDIIDEYSDEEPKDDHDNIRQNLQFYNDLGAIKPLNTSNQQDQQPEVLSDVYPVDAPLVVPKNNNSKNVLDKSAYSNTITPTLQSSNMFEDLFVKPKQQNKNKEYDDVSIGSFSPDTPVKGKSPLRTEIGDALDDDEEDDQVARNNSLSSLRRSVILDRLTQSTKSIIHNTSIDDDVGVEEEEEEEEVKGFSFNDSTDSHSHFSNHSLNDSHSQHSRGSRELEELSQEQGSRIATPEKVSRTATPEQLDQSLYSNQSEQSFTTNNSQRSSSNTITNTPIQVKRTRTPDFVNRTPSQERVKNTPVQVKRTPTPEHINRTPSQERVRNTPIQVKRTPTPEHVKRTPSQDCTRSTPLQTTQTPREEIQMTPTHKLLYQQGNNMSPTLQKLLHTPSFNQPPVSQIPTPNSLRSPPNQSYSVSELSYNHLPRNISGVEMEDEEEEDGEEEQSSSEENNHDDSITPLTSMNSLTPIDERRKSKPVHEMFMPILGKFDELAEKLAELDDILK